MELKWHLIEDGKMKGIPRDEEVIFTVLDEDTGEVRTASGKVDEHFLKKYGYVFVGTPRYPVETKTLKAWMELPPPYKPKNKCFNCEHLEEWTDAFGDRWSECKFGDDVFSTTGCPLRCKNGNEVASEGGVNNAQRL